MKKNPYLFLMLIITAGLLLFFSLYKTALSKLENLKLAKPDISLSFFKYYVEEKNFLVENLDTYL